MWERRVSKNGKKYKWMKVERPNDEKEELTIILRPITRHGKSDDFQCMHDGRLPIKTDAESFSHFRDHSIGGPSLKAGEA